MLDTWPQLDGNWATNEFDERGSFHVVFCGNLFWGGKFRKMLKTKTMPISLLFTHSLCVLHMTLPPATFNCTGGSRLLPSKTWSFWLHRFRCKSFGLEFALTFSTGQELLGTYSKWQWFGRLGLQDDSMTLWVIDFMSAHQVVGGADHGGILVRSGFELTSEPAETRLSTGSLVKVDVPFVAETAVFVCHRLSKCYSRQFSHFRTSFGQEVENKDGRICYELISGDGPRSGWVSSKLRGKVGANLQQVKPGKILHDSMC